MRCWPLNLLGALPGKTAGLLPLMLALGLPEPLHAQPTRPIDEVRHGTRSHIGPFYVMPGLTLRDVGIDGNVFNEPERPKSDFSLTLGPQANIAVPSRRLLLTSTVGADFVYYRTYSSERSVNPRFTPRAAIFFDRLSFAGESSYSRSRQRPSFEIDTRSLRTERSLRGGVAYRLSPKLGIEASGQRSAVSYAAGETFLDVSLQETLNRHSNAITTAVKYSVTPLTTFVLKADRSQDRFELSPERDADTLRVTPGLELNTRALISGSAYIGVRRFKTKSDALEDFHGLVASAALAYTLLGRTTLLLSADRDVTYSFERFQPYYVADTYGLTVRQHLVGRYHLMGGAGRYRYTYRRLAVNEPHAAPIPAPADERVDVTDIYSISVGYDVGPGLRLSVGTTLSRRHSNFARDRQYQALRTGASVDCRF